MGRKPKPFSLQLSEGDRKHYGKHKLQKKLLATPNPTRGLLECPKHLKGRAREAWNFYAAELQDMQLDARCDVGMLEELCVCYALAVEAQLRIAKQGMILEEPVYVRGELQKDLVRLKKHPAVAVYNAAAEKFKSFCSEFGFSPAARVRLAVTAPAHDDSDVQAALFGPRLTAAEKEKMQ